MIDWSKGRLSVKALPWLAAVLLPCTASSESRDEPRTGRDPSGFRHGRKSIGEIDLNRAIHLTRAIYLTCSHPEWFFKVDSMKLGGVRSVPRISVLMVVSAAPLMAAQTTHLSIDASKAGAKINRNAFGLFAESLGHGFYEGIWVGPESPILNTRGIRNDVVTALRALKVRQPGIRLDSTSDPAG